MQNKKRTLIILVVALVVVVVAIILLTSGNGGNQSTNNGVSGSSPTASTTGPTFKALDAKEASAYEITKPTEKAPTPPKYTGPDINVYEIKASKDGFSPETLVIGNTGPVQIKFTAVDGNYDLSFAPPIGAYIAASQGGSTVFGFNAKDVAAGAYTFTCKTSCPSGKAIQGTLIIK